MGVSSDSCEAASTAWRAQSCKESSATARTVQWTDACCGGAAVRVPCALAAVGCRTGLGAGCRPVGAACG
eukprot:1195078-Alexandrium_andersonii.AAC.1